MDKEQVADILDEIGILLALKGENPFRCNAYHNASRTIQQLTEDLGKIVREDRLASIKGIGETLTEKIATLVTTGHLPFYEDLKKQTPAGLLDMLKLPGVGPKKVKVLYEELKIDDLAKLKVACEANDIAGLKGFGAKTQQKILEGLEVIDRMGKRVRLDVALAIAQRIVAGMETCKGIQRMELCGSLRRRRETIADIDLLVSASKSKGIMEHFVKLEGVARVLGQGETKSSIEIEIDRNQSIQADLRVVSEEQFPFALHYFTGSKDHNIAMRARAQSYGLKLNEYE
ncbi:MAG: helix-hairpin-helix domain-containing protein, partial [Gemmataceae bacterium]